MYWAKGGRIFICILVNDSTVQYLYRQMDNIEQFLILIGPIYFSYTFLLTCYFILNTFASQSSLNGMTWMVDSITGRHTNLSKSVFLSKSKYSLTAHYLLYPPKAKAFYCDEQFGYVLKNFRNFFIEHIGHLVEF